MRASSGLVAGMLMATYLITELCARSAAPKMTTVLRVVQHHHFPWVFTTDLLDTWLVRQDLPRVVDEVTAIPSVARAFSRAPTGDSGKSNT